MISAEQYDEIEDKYGKLIHKISQWISGDTAIATHDDNVQDLWVATMEAIQGFAKKEQMPFEEFWGSTAFDKYLKTCLWNHKNNKGAKISKKMNLTKYTVSANDNEEVLGLEAPKIASDEVPVLLEEFAELLCEDEQNVREAILTDPKYFKPSGKANVAALSRDLDITWRETKELIASISKKINNEL